ncbi:hypothetical protein DF186_21440, partial [Enterococcus hirae]
AGGARPAARPGGTLPGGPGARPADRRHARHRRRRARAVGAPGGTRPPPAAAGGGADAGCSAGALAARACRLRRGPRRALPAA